MSHSRVVLACCSWFAARRHRSDPSWSTMHKTNNLAIVSLIAGVLAWFAAPVLASIVAIVTVASRTK